MKMGCQFALISFVVDDRSVIRVVITMMTEALTIAQDHRNGKTTAYFRARSFKVTAL